MLDSSSLSSRASRLLVGVARQSTSALPEETRTALLQLRGEPIGILKMPDAEFQAFLEIAHVFSSQSAGAGAAAGSTPLRIWATRLGLPRCRWLIKDNLENKGRQLATMTEPAEEWNRLSVRMQIKVVVDTHAASKMRE